MVSYGRYNGLLASNAAINLQESSVLGACYYSQ